MSAWIGIAVLVALVLGMGVALWAFINAPMGWEDETGFHYGTPPDGGEA